MNKTCSEEKVFIFSIFKNKEDIEPKHISESWDNLCSEIFSKHTSLQHKNGRAISAAKYKDKTTRKNANVIELSAAVLDFDKGVIQDAKEMLVLFKCEAVLYSTYSHSDAEPKFRVIIPFNQPMPAENWADGFQLFNEAFDGQIDQSTKAVAQIFYLPSCPIVKNDPPVYWRSRGKFFDWQYWMSDWKPKSTSLKPSMHDDDTKDIRTMSTQVFADLFNSNLRHFEGSFYAFTGGYWHKVNRTSGLIKPILIKFPNTSLHAACQIADTLATLHEVESMHSMCADSHRNLAFENGTLDLVSGDLVEANIEHNLIHGFDLEWNPEATCDVWLATLDEIFRDDPDRAERILFLQEFFGYCLTRDTSQQCFLWLVGNGANGKSIILSTLTTMVGERNVSNAKIERLGNSFARAQLQGKLLNVSHEMSASATVADSYLKEIVSSDRIEAEHKGLPPFSFTPTLKIVASTNLLPRLRDTSDGFFRRAIILRFSRQFSVEERNTNLGSQLTEEMMGIIAWAVEGLVRLRERGNFLLPSSAIEEAASYREESDHLLTFIKECLIPSEQGTKCDELYTAYAGFVAEGGFQRMNKNTFGKRLREANYKKRKSNGSEYWLLALK